MVLIGPEDSWLDEWAVERARASLVVQLLVPDRRAAFRCEVEQVPEGFERAQVPRILAGIGGGVEELGAPEVTDRVAFAVEDVQHRPLMPFRGLGQVVAVVGVGGR